LSLGRPRVRSNPASADLGAARGVRESAWLAAELVRCVGDTDDRPPSSTTLSVTRALLGRDPQDAAATTRLEVDGRDEMTSRSELALPDGQRRLRRPFGRAFDDYVGDYRCRRSLPGGRSDAGRVSERRAVLKKSGSASA
jgi:hypothetical protein